MISTRKESGNGREIAIIMSKEGRVIELSFEREIDSWNERILSRLFRDEKKMVVVVGSNRRWQNLKRERRLGLCSRSPRLAEWAPSFLPSLYLSLFLFLSLWR